MTQTTDIDPKLFRIIERQFEEHLLLEGNLRTIFSGKFGSGKSTFLRHFWAQNSTPFIPITLHPVNYSIASNEDIFEYIKFDLLLELLPLVPLSKLKGLNLDLPEKALLYWYDRPLEILKKAATLIGSMGKSIHPSLEILDKLAHFFFELNKGVKSNYEEIEDKSDEHRIMMDYYKKIREKTSSLYEDTVVTRLIEKLVALLKTPDESGDSKNVVVIIEDLDRIDPEHIFRILNVFSAHFDSKQIKGQNSFGVDTLVAVCDEENIRNIFSNRYGANVDYSGYIDKFFSLAIFHFNYADLAHNYIGESISEMNIYCPGGRRPSDSVFNTVQGDGFLQLVLTLLFDHKYVSLRAINRVLKKGIPYQPAQVQPGRYSLSLSNHLIILELLILADICGGIQILKTYIDQLTYIDEHFDKRTRIFERLLAVLMGTEGIPVETGQALITVSNTTYRGFISSDSEHQSYVHSITIVGSAAASGIELVKSKQLFLAISQTLAVIARSPALKLHSYYHV